MTRLILDIRPLGQRAAKVLAMFALALVSASALKAAEAPLLTRVEIEGNSAAAQLIDPITWRGRPTVLYVWGDWCRACARSTPEMLALAERHPAVRFVFINTDDPARPLSMASPDNVVDARVQRAYFGEQVMRKKGFRFSELGLVFGIPAYFVIDAAGRLTNSGNGSRFPSEIDAILSRLSPVSAPPRPCISCS